MYMHCRAHADAYWRCNALRDTVVANQYICAYECIAERMLTFALLLVLAVYITFVWNALCLMELQCMVFSYCLLLVSARGY
jgi:membrane-anchored protein YejM (alkaline phosphatase superfamily)